MGRTRYPSLLEIMSPLVDVTGQLRGVSLHKDKLFFTADTHFFHGNICRYTGRPYDSVDEMNSDLVRRWNERVPRNAIVFILGDLALGGKRRAEELADIINALSGRIFLVGGNHDNYLFNSPECLAGIEILPQLVEIRVSDQECPRKRQRIVLSHFALSIWNRSHHGTWNLHGHSHHTMPRNLNKLQLDVGIDGEGYGYAPISYEFIKRILSEHSNVPIDHHNERTN